MNLKKIKMLSIYTIWDRLSLKTISRYCPFKKEGAARYRNMSMHFKVFSFSSQHF
jgi:hypothetical protein